MEPLFNVNWTNDPEVAEIWKNSMIRYSKFSYNTVCSSRDFFQVKTAFIWVTNDDIAHQLIKQWNEAGNKTYLPINWSYELQCKYI